MKMKTRTMTAVAAFAVLGSTVPAAAQVQSGNTAGSGAAAVATTATTTPAHSASMDRLLQAAQRLRETIQALANAPAGPQRNAAIETAREALLDTQAAMIELPPELRTRSAKPMSDAQYAQAMDELKRAAQRLRDAAQAMAQQPAGERRNDAVAQVNEALMEVNQAMVQLPWQPGGKSTRTGGTPGSAVAGKAASGGSGAIAFETLDRNRDGMLSRDEYQRKN